MEQRIIRTEQQINEQLDKASQIINNDGTHYPGMSYEQGIQAMYDWLVGDTEDTPIE